MTAFRSGFIGVIGKPNVGKSTLINGYMGQKIAAVSSRPQTTQRNQLGILTTDDYQMIFIDTPGIHKPVSKLGGAMNENAISVLNDADCLLWIVDISKKPNAEDQIVADRIVDAGVGKQVILVMNKADLVNPNQLAENEQFYKKLLPEAMRIPVSARKRTGCDELLQVLKERMPEGPAFYDSEQITDLYERDLAADMIRESLLKNLSDEIPHAIAVRIDSFIDRTETNSYISATLLLDREAHKGIVIGKNGEMIKRIGQDARREIEKMTERKVYLEIRVKVMRNWMNNPEILRGMGILKESDS